MTSGVEQYRMAYPKFKAYIFGVEVTQDVVSINASHHDGNAPNTCSITLLNELDKYIITTQDLVKINGLSNEIISVPWLDGTLRIGQSSMLDSVNTAGVDATTFSNLGPSEYLSINETKRRILEAKRNVVASRLAVDDFTDPTGAPLSSRSPSFANYFGTEVKRYPLADGAPVFHAMDQVRVFMRDPYNPSRWYHHFAGFISDMVDNSDENNVKTLTILVEDVTKLFRYSRVFLNPGIADAKSVIQNENDLKVQSFYSNFLKGLTLPEVLFTLIFGPDKVNSKKLTEYITAESARSNIGTSLRGIGHFDYMSSGIFTFGSSGEIETTAVRSASDDGGLFDTKPQTHLKDLSTWDAIIDHEVHQSDLYSMLSESQKVSNGEALAAEMASTLPKSHNNLVDIEAVVDQIGRRPDLYPVDGGKLYMLLPEGFGAGNSNIISNDIIQSYGMNSEWRSAGEIIMGCIERIQFCMYASPKGDLIIEPPLYDFDPDDFGMVAIRPDEFIGQINTKLIDQGERSVHEDLSHLATIEQAEQTIPSNNRGPFGPAYVVRKAHTYNWESAIIDEKVHTMATSAANIFQNWDTLGNMSIIGQLAVIKLPELIPLYGVRALPVAAPGYVESPEGAYLYASISLNRQNADAHTFRVNMQPNIALRLNRPIYIEGRNCIATTKQISQSITWGAAGDMSTTIDLYATRTWNGQISTDSPPQPIYTPIGGNVSAALNYATLYKKRAVPKPLDTSNASENEVADRRRLGGSFDIKIIDDGGI